MKATGWAELGRRCGLSRATIYNFASGQCRPTPENRTKMQSGLGIDPTAWDHEPTTPAPINGKVAAPVLTTTIVVKPPEPDSSSEVEPEIPPLIRTGSNESQRGQTLEDVRSLIANVKNRIEHFPAEKDAAPLANALRNLLVKEGEMVAAMESTTTGWANSREFLALIDRIYDTLKPYPDAVEAMNIVFTSDR